MRTLFLSPWFPSPPDNGSKIRILYLLRALAQRHQVTLVTYADPDDRMDEHALEPYCRLAGVVAKPHFQPKRARAVFGFVSPVPRSLVDTFSPPMARLIQEELAQKEFDVIVASQIDMARYLSGLSTVPSIFEEVETTVIREEYDGASSQMARFRAWLTWSKTRRYIRHLVRQFDACTVVSEQERAHVMDIVPDCGRVAVVPNGVDVEALRSGEFEPEPGTLVYNGALTYSANYDAMRFFLDEIWQQIKASEPAARLQITGRTDGVDLSGLGLKDDTRLTGYIADARPTVARAWACVVPLRIGGGTRLKILEAMALGTPVISTRKGAEGLQVTPGDNILIADKPAEFAAQTVRLMRDPALRKHLAQNARRLVEDRYDWRVIGEQFNQLVESVARQGKRN